MDNNQDVSRFSPATKHHLPAWVKSRKRFQKLSLVGTRVNPETEMGSDQEEDEQLISMLAAKRFKLPPKFLDEDHASVPRKLRSAMKKRNTGSLSPPLQDPKKKKKKQHLHGRDSPKTNPIKKIKKHKGMDRAKSKRANGSITKDEEEVIETLYALAGMFPDNGTAADESSQDPPTTVNQTTESPELEGIDEVSLHEEATEAMKIEPKTKEQTDLVDSIEILKKADSFEEAHQEKTHLLSPSSENLLIRLNIDSQPTATNLEQQHKADYSYLSQPKGPVLWPGLLTASRNSIDGSLRSSSNHESAESSYSTEKICKTTVGKALRKKCTGHVYISHLIRTLQNPDSKHRLSPRDGGEEEEKQSIVNIGPGLAVLQNVRNVAVSANLQQKTNGNEWLLGSHVTQINPTEKQSFDFLSLSGGGLTQNGSGAMMAQLQVPYLQSYPQHQMRTTTHPAHKIHYYPELSTVSSHQLPTYHLGSSGRAALQKGPTREHQQPVWTVPQISPAQYKPVGSCQVAQFPSWQNGRVDSSSSAAMHDLMTQYNHNHHQQQLQLQQQYVSLRASMAGPSLGKRQEHHHLGLSSVVREETAMRFHRGSSLSLQLLCNDQL